VRFNYFRVSSDDQSIESQRVTLGGADLEFIDENVSGAVLALDRPGFATMFAKLRHGDEVAVYAVDRLGRDALDIQSTVRKLLDMGVTVNIHGLGPISRGVGEIILAVLSQVADLERRRIRERCDAGRAAARKALDETGRTHHGKASLGRPHAADAEEVRAWRRRTGSSIAKTAERFKLSVATVKRYCSAAVSEAA